MSDIFILLGVCLFFGIGKVVENGFGVSYSIVW